MLAIRSGTLANTPATQILVGEVAKPAFDRLSQDDEVGVKCR